MPCSAKFCIADEGVVAGVWVGVEKGFRIAACEGHHAGGCWQLPAGDNGPCCLSR
jgi:putative component of membrane protein insertase Oxa1/YidC/SpoIIIJ protein YidD